MKSFKWNLLKEILQMKSSKSDLLMKLSNWKFLNEILSMESFKSNLLNETF